MQDRGSLWGDTFIKLVFIGIPLVLFTVIFTLSLTDLLATLAPKPGKRTTCKLSSF